MAQREVADPLYGNPGDYPQDSENKKGGQVQQEHNSQAKNGTG